MAAVGDVYTSGNWSVKEGSVEAFLDQWRALADYCIEHGIGARYFRLIRDRANPRHFVSFGEWDGREALSLSRARPEFLRLWRGCQQLCDEFSGSDYEVALDIETTSRAR
jgi:quinol monooxygenase YgiN